MIELLSNIPWGEVRFAEGIQIVIGIVTIVVTINIYRQQRKYAARQEKSVLENKATQFIINNRDEMDYLPLCILANDLHRKEKHARNIYTQFCKCSDELQTEIIAQTEIDSIIHIHTEEISDWIASLKNDIATFNLGKDILYDGAKYFTRAFERYRHELWIDPNQECVFERVLPYNAMTVAFGNNKITFSNYAEEYIEWQKSCEGDRGREIVPPIDYMCQKTHWQSVDEKTACMWILEVVRGICVAMYKEHSEEYEKNNFLPCCEVQPKTFEDMYYIAIQWLYTAYGKLNI